MGPLVKIGHTLGWVKALCSLSRGGLCATALLNPALSEFGLTLILDASPWGAGGFVADKGEPLEWFATTWSDVDVEMLKLRKGDHRDQALFETYAVLIGARFWAHLWQKRPSTVTVKSVSMAALGALQRGGATRNAGMNRILKELALETALTSTGLRLTFKHLKGSRNEWADALSRLGQPGSGARVPAPLLSCRRTDVEQRTRAWWRTEGMAEEVLAGAQVEGAE